MLQSDNDISEVKNLLDKTMSLIDVLEVSMSEVLFSAHRMQLEGVPVEIGVDHIKAQHVVDEAARGVDDINKVRIRLFPRSELNWFSQQLSSAMQLQEAIEHEEHLVRTA